MNQSGERNARRHERLPIRPRRSRGDLEKAVEVILKKGIVKPFARR